ncbi:hypothetical protein J6590_053622 [Homalodisca vitripennis]|nr:hypothetical protein J6590_053622 [Homalodisca vitripennis]
MCAVEVTLQFTNYRLLSAIILLTPAAIFPPFLLPLIVSYGRHVGIARIYCSHFSSGLKEEFKPRMARYNWQGSFGNYFTCDFGSTVLLRARALAGQSFLQDVEDFMALSFVLARYTFDQCG